MTGLVLVLVLVLGNRYRWTVEGIAVDIGNGDAALESCSDRVRVFSAHLLSAGTVERLPDPLPTTPGSVVRAGGQAWELSGTLWRNVVGNEWSAEDLAQCWPGATVLFDAGATQ